MILGIDPGTRCGWSVLTSDGACIASGVEDLSAKRIESPGVRYLRARSLFRRLLAEYASTLVVYEEVRRHQGTTAAHVYGGIVAELLAECAAAGVEVTGVPVGEVKRTATGKGNADKPAMVAAARDRWNVEPATDDEADALWVAECGRRLAGGS